ncbi:MAG: hypothetical protein ABSA58_15575 [Acetobacteraceae bacterium]|jgi:hypothetical protein
MGQDIRLTDRRMSAVLRHGEVRIDYASSGLRWTLEFPQSV